MRNGAECEACQYAAGFIFYLAMVRLVRSLLVEAKLFPVGHFHLSSAVEVLASAALCFA